jgi:hypothetical protein
MLAIWQVNPARLQPQHETVYWDDEHRGARSSGAERTHAGVQQNPQSGRVKINER